MAAIITTNTLGLSNVSRDQIALQGGNPAAGRSGESVYVNAKTGNLVVQQQDELLAALGQDIAVLRTYNSLGQLDGDNNDNWRIGFYRQLGSLAGAINASGSSIVRVREDGAEQKFTWNGSAYVSTDGDGSHDTLSSYTFTNASGQTVTQWTYTDGDSRATETYDWSNGNGNGKLLSQADAAGNAISYSYNAAGLLTRATSANSSGTQFNYTDLVYDAAANLQSVANNAWDAASNSNRTITRVSYGYEAWSGGSRLKTVTVDLTPDNGTDSKTYVTSYAYVSSTSTQLSTLTQADGTSLSFSYDSNNRLASVTDALGNVTSYAYDTANSRTSVTDALGNVTTYEYDAAGQLARITAPAVGGVSASQSFTWDASGNLTMSTDGEGKRVVMQYDANGNLTLQRDEAGNTIERAYDSRNQLVSETTYLSSDPDGADPANGNSLGAPSGAMTTRYVYDAAGKSQLRFVISPEGRVSEIRYDTLGQRTASISYRGNTYTGASATESSLQSWLDTADKTQSQRTDYTYDFRGQLASSTTWGSVDAGGNGVAGSAATTTFVYGPNGQLISTIAPLGGAAQTNTFTYDGLGRTLTAVNGLGQVTSSVYDDVGRQTTITAANGLTVINSYDLAGRLVGVLQTGASVNAQTCYYYDADNQLRMTRDANGVASWNLYDAAGRKVGEIDGNGSLTETVYDRNDRVTKTIRYANAVDTALLTVDPDGKPSAAALGLTLASLRPAAGADQASWNIHDNAGRLIKTVDAGGAVTEMSYDGSSRLVKTTVYANAIATASLPAQPTSAQVAPAANADSDRITRVFYDSDGLQRALLDAEGYLTETVYNNAGQAYKYIAYATATNSALRATGTLDQLRPASAAADQISYTLYDARGAVTGEIDAEGYLTETSHDANGNVTQIKRYATATRASIGTGTLVSSVRPTSSPQDRIQVMTYDALDRMASSTSHDGTVTTYAYDAAGNLASTTVASGTAEARTTSSSYDALGNRLTEVDGRGKTTTHQYDALGKLIASTDALGNRTLFYYNEDGLAVASVNALGEVTTSTWNSLHQKTAVTEYGARLDSLTGMTGGLLDSLTKNRFAALASAGTNGATTYTYNIDGSLASTTDAVGNVVQYGYNNFDEQTSVTVPVANGSSVTALSYDRRGLKVSETIDPSGLNLVTATQYDAFGRVIAETDARNGQLQIAYDRNGRQIRLTDAAGGVGTIVYDAFARVLSKTDALGHATTTSYNDSARSMTVTTPEGISVTTVYNRHGQTLTLTDGLNNVTTYSYDGDGNLTGVTGGLGLSTSVTYGDTGLVLQSTDAAGTATAYTYDAAGRVLTRTVDADRAGYTGLKLTTSYAYDARGRTISITDPRGVATVSEYDNKGQLVRETVDPAGLNLVTQLSYDGSGREVSVTDPSGTVTQYTYDKAGRRVMERVDPQGLNLTTQYSYDGNGNLASSTDAAGNVVRNVYDARDQLTYTVDAVGAVTRYEYDAAGNMIRRTAYAATIAANAAPSSVQATFGADQITRNVFDDDDRLVRSIDSMGAITDYRYDANGRLTGSTAYAQSVNLALGRTATQSSTGTGSGAVAARAVDGNTSNRWSSGSITYTNNETNAWWQVDLGSVQDMSTIELYNRDDGLGSRLSNFYVFVSDTDLTGRTYAAIVADTSVRKYYFAGEAPQRLTIAAVTSGRYVRVQLSGTNYLSLAEVRVNGTTPLANASADQIVNYEYDAAGRQTRTLYPNSTVYNTESASALALNGATSVAARVETSATLFTQKGYDAAGNVVFQRDAAGNMRYQAWDAAGRLVYEVDALGYVTGRQYDAQGNVVAITRYADQIANGDPQAAWGESAPSASTIASLLNSGSSANRTTTMTYDAAGRKTLETRPAVYAYDGASAFNASPVTRTTYNARGDVVRSEELRRDNLWDSSWTFYDAAGRQTATVDALGYLTRRTYDAAGNVTEIAEYANPVSAVSSTGYAMPAASARDRIVRMTYDGNGRKLTETQVNAEYLASTTQNGVTLYTNTGYAGNSASATAGWYNLADLGIAAGTLSSIKVAAGWKATLYYYGNYGGATVTITGDTSNLGSVGFDNLASSIAIVNGNTVSDLTTSYAYDAFGNQIRCTDGGNNSTYTWYDQANRIRAVADPARQGASANSTVIGLTQYVRDAFGNVIEKTDHDNGATTVAATGFTFSSSVSAKDRVSSIRYDSRGRKTEVTDALGNKVYYSYDANGNLAKQWQGVTGNDGVTRTVYTATVYDRRGLAVSVNDSGKQTQMAYNAFGELVARGGRDGLSAAMGWQEYFDYDNGGRLWRSNGGDGVDKVTLYDLQGRFTAEIRSASADLRAQANAAAVHALAGTRRIESRSDALGRVLEQKMANGASVFQTWDRWGNRLSVSDARDAGWITEYAYNRNNQVTKETLPTVMVLGNNLTSPTIERPVTETFYDHAGNLVAQRDARGHLIRKAWDAMGNLLTEFNANGSSIRHYYNAFNEEVQKVDAKGNATGYAYDKMGRLTTVTRAAAEFYLINSGSYDATASDSQAPVAVYDDSGYGGRVSFFGDGTWDGLAKNISSVKVKSGWSVKFFDDDSGIDGGAQNVTFTSSQSSLSSDLNDDVKKIQVWRTSGDEAVVSLAQNSTSLLSYTYDQLGRRLTATDARNSIDGRTFYTYDLAGRVTGIRQPGESASSTQYQYDAAGYKSAETNALGDAMSWTNDYFGRAVSHTSLDGAVTAYTYDEAGQLTQESSTSGRQVTNTYNTAGQITRIVDKVTSSTNRTTDYQYDAAGNRTKEITQIGTATYQNQDLLYDPLGRLLSVTDVYGSSYAKVQYAYDLLGNRMMQTTAINMTSPTEAGATSKTTYFAYDALNRVVLVDGAVDNFSNNSANITAATGRRVYYDLNGNRTREDTAGLVEEYTYDTLNRLTRITRNGSTVRYVKYDLADRVLESYDTTQSGETSVDHYTNVYDSLGRMQRQFHRSGSTLSGTSIISTRDESVIYYTYNALGNVTRTSTQRFGEYMFFTSNDTSYVKIGDRYLQSQILGKRTDNGGDPGYSNFTYDLNGYLTAITDQDGASNNRTFQNNAKGQILRKAQGSAVTKVMLANGQQLGSYDNAGGRNFDVAYQEIDTVHPGAGPGSYTVNAGDTLQGIAFNTYGDRSMWYLIADANGIFSDAELRAGMQLKLPAVVGSNLNNAQTYKPYDSSSVIGATDPTLNTPASSSNTCQTVGVIIAAVIASVVISALAVAATTFTLGLAGAPSGLLATAVISMIWAGIGGAAASMASQGIMIAAGMQDHMDWTEVAVGAATDMVTGGIGLAIGAAVKSAVKSATRASRAAALAEQAAQKGAGAVDDAQAALAAVGKVKKPNFVQRQILEIYGEGNATRTLASNLKRIDRGVKLKETAGAKKLFAKKMLVELTEEIAANVLNNAVEQGIQMVAGKRDNFDTDYLEQSIFAPSSMKRAELQRSVHAERTFFDRLQKRADTLMASAVAKKDAAKVKQLEVILEHVVDGGRNTLPIEADWSKRIRTVVMKYTGKSATPWNLSANGVRNISDAIHSSDLSLYARFTLLLGFKSGGSYAIAESDNRQLATGQYGSMGNAALTSVISGGAANIATRLHTQRLAGMKVINLKLRGTDTRISAQYTDTASFQALQYGLNAAASLVANTAWDLADGNLSHLDAMRQDASEEMMRMAAFHQIRHRGR